MTDDKDQEDFEIKSFCGEEYKKRMSLCNIRSEYTDGSFITKHLDGDFEYTIESQRIDDDTYYNTRICMEITGILDPEKPDINDEYLEWLIKDIHGVDVLTRFKEVIK